MEFYASSNLSEHQKLIADISEEKNSKAYRKSFMHKDDEIRSQIMEEIAPLRDRVALLKSGRWSYKNLCSFLGEKSYNNIDKRKNQYLRWGCWFDFEVKKKGMINILDVYISPNIEEYLEDKLFLELRGEYSTHIYNLLMLYFSHISNAKPDAYFFEIMASKSELYKLFGFANESFFGMHKDERSPREEEKYIESLDDQEREEYFKLRFYKKILTRKAWGDFDDILEDALAAMHRTKTIDYIYQTFVYAPNGILPAKAYLRSIITRAQGEVLHEMQYETEREAYINGLFFQYKENVVRQVNEDLSKLRKSISQKDNLKWLLDELPSSISNYWEGYSIWTSKGGIYYGLNRLLGKGIKESEEECQKQIEKINVSELEKAQVEGLNTLIINRFLRWFPASLETDIDRQARQEIGFMGDKSLVEVIKELEKNKFFEYKKEWVDQYLKILDTPNVFARSWEQRDEDFFNFRNTSQLFASDKAEEFKNFFD